MSQVPVIHPRLTRRYERDYERAYADTRTRPDLRSMPLLLSARRELKAIRTGTMTITERAVHNGLLDTIAAMIAEQDAAQAAGGTS